MDYIVEKIFKHKNCVCVVTGSKMGHRCGYVGITKEHPLFGVGYSGPNELLKKKFDLKQPIGKRGSIPLLCSSFSDDVRADLFFDVHGSLTFSHMNDTGYPIWTEQPLWFFGFDCAHCDDAKDIELYQKLNGKDKPVPDWIRCFDEGEVRSSEYVEKECISLADQLDALTKED